VWAAATLSWMAGCAMVTCRGACAWLRFCSGLWVTTAAAATAWAEVLRDRQTTLSAPIRRRGVWHCVAYVLHMCGIVLHMCCICVALCCIRVALCCILLHMNPVTCCITAVRLSLQRDPGARCPGGQAVEEEGDSGERTAAVWRRYRPFLPATAEMTTLLCFDPHGQDTAALADAVLVRVQLTHRPSGASDECTWCSSDVEPAAQCPYRHRAR
jgi:hypothetical protein